MHSTLGSITEAIAGMDEEEVDRACANEVFGGVDRACANEVFGGMLVALLEDKAKDPVDFDDFIPCGDDE